MLDLTELLNQLWTLIQNSSASGVNVWIYALLTFIVIFEGPLAILFASTAASAGFMRPVLVFASASVGNLIADTLWYSLGYYGKLDWVTKQSRWLNVDLQKIEIIKKAMHKHAVKILIVSKLTNGLIVPTLVATGLARVPFRRWFPYIFFANAIVTGIFVTAGYYASNALLKIQSGMKYVALGSSFILILVISFYISRLLRQKLEEDTLSNSAEEPVVE